MLFNWKHGCFWYSFIYTVQKLQKIIYQGKRILLRPQSKETIINSHLKGTMYKQKVFRFKSFRFQRNRVKFTSRVTKLYINLILSYLAASKKPSDLIPNFKFCKLSVSLLRLKQIQPWYI